MAIASRQLSRLRQRTQELKAQEQTLKRETEMLKAQEQTLQRETARQVSRLQSETETLKAQEQKLKNLLSIIESEKPKTPKKENFTLNSLRSSLSPKTVEAIEGTVFMSVLERLVVGKTSIVLRSADLKLNRDHLAKLIRDAQADAFEERVFELSEFDENAIVSKRAQVVEEVNSDHQHQVELDLHHG